MSEGQAILVADGDGAAWGLELLAFAEGLAAAGAAALRLGPLPGAPPGPVLSVLDGAGRPLLHSRGVPDGHEGEAFRDVLDLAAGAPLPVGVAEALRERGRAPAHLELFLHPACLNCPGALRAAAAVAAADPATCCCATDVSRLPEEAARRGVKTTPTTFLDGVPVALEALPADALARLVAGRGGAAHALAVLRAEVERGDAEAAARHLAVAGVAAGVVALYAEADLGLRTGLALALETAVEEDPACLRPAVPALTALLASAHPTLRGDAADLLALAGDEAAIPALEALLDDENADVAELAAEAIERLQG
jgi:hypothetical protein